MGMVRWYSPAAVVTGVTSAGFTESTILLPWCGRIQRVRCFVTAGPATSVLLQVRLVTGAPAVLDTVLAYSATATPLDSEEDIWYGQTVPAGSSYYVSVFVALSTNNVAASSLNYQLQIESPVPAESYGLGAI